MGTAFSRWLRQELDNRGLGVRELARALDPAYPERARRNLHRYLNGSVAPNPPMRKRIADALGLAVDDLPGEEPSVAARPHSEILDVLIGALVHARETASLSASPQPRPGPPLPGVTTSSPGVGGGMRRTTALTAGAVTRGHRSAVPGAGASGAPPSRVELAPAVSAATNGGL
jgi:transcriptional regulator with XRE-family HTH domain